MPSTLRETTTGRSYRFFSTPIFRFPLAPESRRGFYVSREGARSQARPESEVGNNVRMSDCLFCRIVAGTIPSTKVHEDELCVGFRDIAPHAPEHVLFIPKRHLATLNEPTSEDRELLGHLMISAAKFAREAGVADSGYRVVMNTNADAGQTVFHIHLHLLAGRKLAWPPG